jgi:O-antigen/teichoic acid export membrane protein
MLKQKFIVQYGSMAITQILGMVAGIVVARLAGPGVMGMVAYGTSYVSLLGFINGIFGSAHIKLVSEGREHSECMAVYTRLQIICALIYFTAVLALFLIQKNILHYPFESREQEWIILIALLTHTFELYGQYANTIFTANLQQAKANLPNFFKTIIFHIGRILIVIFFVKNLALKLYSWHLILAILFIPIIHRLLKEYPIGKYNNKLAKKYFKYGGAIFFMAVIDSVTHSIDKLMLAHFTNTTQLGYYSAAHSIGGLILTLAGSAGLIFFPLFSGYISRGDWESVNTKIYQYHEFIILFIFPLICLLAIVGGPIMLLILGNKYKPSIIPFQILIFATYISVIGMPYGNIITGMGKFNLAVVINIIRLGAFLISLFILIAPNMLNLGAVGLAANQLVLNLTRNGLYLYFANKLGEVRLKSNNNIRHIIIIGWTLLNFLISIYLKKFIPLWWLLMIPLYLIPLYWILNITGLMKKEHWKLLLDTLNVKKTLKYAYDEIR